MEKELMLMKSMFSFMKGNILVLTVSQIAMFFSMRMAMPYFSLYVLAHGGTPTARARKFLSVFLEHDPNYVGCNSNFDSSGPLRRGILFLAILSRIC